MPTFDDMLAAELLARLLAGEPLPENCEAFAECAKLIREGLRPGEVPPERSVEGIYLAILNNAGENLAQPPAEQQFCRDWARMARRVMQAARQGLDPFTTPLFDGPDFARERAFLARDDEVYRQDVARGARGIVSLPGGPPKASARLLQRPKCSLLKSWARSDKHSPTGDGYLLLLVHWAPGEWVISTDPVQRLSLKPLAERLQAAEAECDAQSAASDPWFDGPACNHSMVAAPHARSKLPDETILRIVKAWCTAGTPHDLA